MIDYKTATEIIYCHDKYDGETVSFPFGAERTSSEVIGITAHRPNAICLIVNHVKHGLLTIDPTLVEIHVEASPDHSKDCSFKPDEEDGGGACDCKGSVVVLSGRGKPISDGVGEYFRDGGFIKGERIKVRGKSKYGEYLGLDPRGNNVLVVKWDGDKSSTSVGFHQIRLTDTNDYINQEAERNSDGKGED